MAILIMAWLLSGVLTAEPPEINPSIEEQQLNNASVRSDLVPTQVRVTRMNAVEKVRFETIRGKTQNKRTVAVRSEIDGKIVARNVEKGDTVIAGQVLCELAMEDRQSSLTEAKEAVTQAQLEYKGAQKLKARGYNSENAIASARAKLASTLTVLDRRELSIAKTQVKAPFAGSVEDVHMELGEYVMTGAPCATIVDLNPMLIVGRVSEKSILDIQTGIIAGGILTDGREVQGPITFLGQQSNAQTRTYSVEIEIDNSDLSLRSGITTEILIPVERVLAQKISPALFSLDDSGGYGIRLIDSDNIVTFYTVNIVAEDEDGVWVTGLPNVSDVITVGQELVVPGERVDPVFQNRKIAER
jgi:multidrug efflux system membrane fusion protein|tara:strand:- start:5046 stop:6119 length:1074 start_codon:yes stop_codon:yes gene_type:complete